MIKQVGTPDIMLTLSVADNKLPILKEFYSKLGLNTAEKTLFQLNAANPHYQTLFSIKYLENFLKKFVDKIIPLEDIFTSFEFQERGSLHTHSLIWFDAAKVILQLSTIHFLSIN